MSTYSLQSIFNPASVAVVGGSPRERSIARAVLHNLQAGGFSGPIGLVNPRHREIEGVAAVARLADLAFRPELVVIATPAPMVPVHAEAAADAGASAVVVLSTGLGSGEGSFAEQLQAIARARGLRVIGPSSLGVIAPHARLNASFAAHVPLPGDIAVISHSAAIAAALVEWGAVRSIGFSAVAALGDAVDVDFADLLDYFARDRHTRAILLYVESLRDARKFMSAARAAARLKPVVVVKSGRHAQGVAQPATHAAALATPDAVYSAAFHRAGMLRVLALDELFAAAEALGRTDTFPGRRLAILANGRGTGLLAADRLIDMGGTLATLSDEARAQVANIASATWPGTHPVDFYGDIDHASYTAAFKALIADPNNDALLVLNVPTALMSANSRAKALAEARGALPREWIRKPVFAVWLGADDDAVAWLNAARIPGYATEADAVRGFMYLVRHREAQQTLMETPPSLPDDLVVDTATARSIVDGAIDAGRGWLDPVEVARVLGAYGIAITPVASARDPDEAARVAAPMLGGGAPVAVKILSPDIDHKSDVDGVRLNLFTMQAVREAADAILSRARALRPQARIEGVTVHPMVVRPKARELIAGVVDDETFGPVIVFGRGGTAVEVIDDKVLALPPLDLRLAHEMIGRTRVSRILKAYRDVPAADERAVALVLVKLAQLVADIPGIREVDINPLLADRDGLIAVDARIGVSRSRALHKGPGHPRFAILPYPKEWERTITLADGDTAFVRPVRPEDEEMFRTFFGRVSDEDLRMRFFQTVRNFSHEFIAQLTQLDYARSIALVAIAPDTGEMLGAVRLHADANYDRGEYGILVRSDLKGHGLGWRLMQIMIEYARWLGLRVVEGEVLQENRTMIAMCQRLGFSVVTHPDDPGLVVATLPIEPA
ncbi:bifunctional acetate--CoA ligase family protein/GNAT family N-acetyltransferase [Lysobacter sp. LF1]|uniref:Bifunctional acetate--CoA ligase family protein/GNAT family N-acetyltransferase n=1 Tax=Lysobacter stagni TaxID=3045172 RepID=A0ABT6XJC5_9GAMM|nr:bifunctional acetate--CoA ligase family protein/GNAT family N-acetyltransferase [Lysobacter sp. LF1]MDI9240267.1 bifunctional acetate--CoA ligase family protein/GNAT family N-acetyltransferase [Lysobacter sp. LF1]